MKRELEQDQAQPAQLAPTRRFLRKEAALRAQDLQRSIELDLLRPYPAVNIIKGEKCHIGHLLHGIVAMCKLSFEGQPWTNHVSIVNASSPIAVQNTEIHSNVWLLLAIHCTQSHWAFTATHRGLQKTMLYDGKSNPKIRELAKEFSDKIECLNGPPEFEVAVCPEQEDEWSCGHRVVLGVGMLLDHLLLYDGQQRGLLERIPAHFAADDAMQELEHLIIPCKTEVKSEQTSNPTTSTEAKKRAAAQASDTELPKRVKIEEEQEKNTPQQSQQDTNAKERAQEAQGDEEMQGDEAMPTTPKTKKRRIPDKEEASPSGAEDKKKKNKNEKKRKGDELVCPRSKVEEARIKLVENGLQHNDVFQRRHAKTQPARGHWGAFLTDLALGKKPECSICQQLAQEYFHGQPAQDQVEAGVEPPPAPAANVEGLRKRGRPKKGEATKNVLLTWVRDYRPKIYKELENSATDFSYYCYPCEKVVCFFRDSVTYANQHEVQSGQHVRALRAMGLSKSGKEQAERAPCTGAKVEGSKTLLADLLSSLEAWSNAGFPCALNSAARDIIDSCTWRRVGDDFFVRHVDCKANEVISNGCLVCFGILENRKLAKEVAMWGYRVDLARFAYCAAYGSKEEQDQQQQAIQERDYMTLELAGGGFDDLVQQHARSMIFNIRRGIESTPKKFRNQAYEDFIQLRLVGLAEYSLGDIQKNVFSTLIHKFQSSLDEGKCLEEDMRLASMVATGRLRTGAGAVVDALFKSAMHKVQRPHCQKRPNSRAHFSSEMAAELAFMIGRHRCMKEVLRIFGISDVVPKINLQHSLLPQPYASRIKFMRIEEQHNPLYSIMIQR